MKRTICAGLALVLCLGLSACGKAKDPTGGTGTAPGGAVPPSASVGTQPVQGEQARPADTPGQNGREPSGTGSPSAAAGSGSVVQAPEGGDDGEASPLAFRITDSSLAVYQDFSSSSGFSWDGFAEFENTGTVNLKLSEAALAMETEDGRSVSTVDRPVVFPPVLAPGDKGYIVGGFGMPIECPEGTTVEAEFPDVANGTVGVVLRVSAKADYEGNGPVGYGVVDGSASFRQASDGLHMSCSVENRASTQGKGLKAALVVYAGSGAERKAVGIAYADVGDMGPGEIAYLDVGPVSFIQAAADAVPSEWQLYIY